MDDSNKSNFIDHKDLTLSDSEDRKKQFEKILGRISKNFVNISSQENFDNAINDALLKVREFFDTDRTYIFEMSEDEQLMNYAYENCDKTISPQIDNYVSVPIIDMPWWIDRIINDSYIHIPDVKLMPKEADIEKEILLDQEIKSLIVFPIKNKGKLFAFYGLDEVKQKRSWEDKEITLLQILADILAWAYDKKRTEVKMSEIQRQKAQQQNFVSMVSHEFKTPLSIIDSSAQRILRKINSIQPEEIVSRMERIRNSINRLNNLVETTLDLSKLESGKLSINPSMNNLADVVSSVISELQYSTPDRVINFSCSGDTIGIFDPNRIYLIVNNLISNALKYSAGAIDVKCEEEGEYIKFSVSDKGYGLSEEDLKHIGSKFFRAKHTQDIPGTGVGIYLIKNIIEMHNGKLDIKSKLGMGSTFIVYLLKDNDFDDEGNDNVSIF